MFKFSNSADNSGWVRIQHRSLARPCFISGSSPDSLPEWKKEWFYIQLEEDNWDEFFRPDFSRAVDGPVRDLKLGVDELAVVATLTGDSAHHCAILISEDSLQRYHLSGLTEQGILPFSLFLPLLMFVLCFLFLLTLYFLSFQPELT